MEEVLRNGGRSFLPALVGGLVLGLALAPGALAQDAGGAEKARKHAGQASPGAERAERPAIDDLIEQLGAPRWKAREEAERKLVELGDQALEALERAAREHEDPEVRYRAERVVRRIRHGEAAPGRRGGLRRRGGLAPRPQRSLPEPDDLSRMFDSMFERLEREFGLDIPRHRFFADPFFEDLESQLRAMRERLRSLQGGGSPWSAKGQGQALQIRIGPDGVRLEVEERDASGKTEKKVYEAPDLESFRRKYPEVAERYLDGSGGPVLRLRFGTGPWNGGGSTGRGLITPAPKVPRVRRLGSPAPAPRGPRLGVYVSDVPEPVRAFLDLPGDRGLRVEEVEPGSLAERLGIRAGDILLEVAGRPVGTPADVRAALEKKVDRVEVLVNRKGSEIRLEAERGNGTEPELPETEKNEKEKPRGSGADRPDRDGR